MPSPKETQRRTVGCCNAESDVAAERGTVSSSAVVSPSVRAASASARAALGRAAGKSPLLLSVKSARRGGSSSSRAESGKEGRLSGVAAPRKLGRRGFKLGEGGQCRCAYGDGAAARGLAVLCDEATPSSEGMAAAEGKQLVPRGGMRFAAGSGCPPSCGKHSIDRSGISSSESPAASDRVRCKAARPSRTRGARGGRTKESTLESHPAAAPLAEEACEDADGASSTACRSAAARSSTLGKSIGVGRRSVDQRRAMCRTSSTCSACSACSGASPPRASKSCCVRGVAMRREPARRLGLRPKYAWSTPVALMEATATGKPVVASGAMPDFTRSRRCSSPIRPGPRKSVVGSSP
mmetsp:Transcript_5374/g.17289  ORF Transcript_5374/g.17289 Transcript_5374/m.17289 type:complete len:352 (+) Transcript_5374:277-1332(+)